MLLFLGVGLPQRAWRHEQQSLVSPCNVQQCCLRLQDDVVLAVWNRLNRGRQTMSVGVMHPTPSHTIIIAFIRTAAGHMAKCGIIETEAGLTTAEQTPFHSNFLPVHACNMSRVLWSLQLSLPTSQLL